MTKKTTPESASAAPVDPSPTATTSGDAAPASPADGDEVGGPKGPEPTRFGDWERKGRCIDF